MSIAAGEARLPGEEVYRLAAGPYHDGELRVASFVGREALSRLYRFDIVVTSTTLDDTIERAVLGQPARLSLHVGPVERSFQGIIAGVEAQGLMGAEGHRRARHRLRLVPRAWLLTRRKRSRIFQDMRVDQVIATVLLEAGVPVRFRLQHRYPSRRYCTQYAETDFEFVTRLAAECGLFFYFEQPDTFSPGTDRAATEIAAGLGSRLAAQAGQAAAGALGVAGEVLGGALDGALLDAASRALPGEVLVFGDHVHAYPPLDDNGPSAPGDALQNAAAGALGGALGSAIDGAVDRGQSALGEGSAAAGALGSALGAAGDMAEDALGAAFSVRSPAPTLYFREAGALIVPSNDSIASFGARKALRPTASAYREYDPDRPLTPLSASAPATSGAVASLAGAAAGALGGLVPGGAGDALAAGAQLAGAAIAAPASAMEVYEHHGRDLFPDWHYAQSEARRILEQSRRRHHVARGASGCARLHPGRRFALAEHPALHLDTEYVLTAVEHHGTSDPSIQGNSTTSVYRNTFACVPADVPFVPARPAHRVVQSCLSATVVGPAGDDIHVNEKGEIKVRFHWDREGREPLTSCWIRTMQAWGGTGWGSQFIPRVGMEVVVGFDGGDPDRPLVLGCLYNATHPTAFPLPAQKTRSGLRTKSSPYREGFNELSFDDAAGGEQIYLHAQRDFDSEIRRDRTARIQRDDKTEVQRDQHLAVRGEQITQVDKDRRVSVGGDDHLRVAGSRQVSVEGDQRERVRGERSAHVEGREHTEVEGDRRLRVSGDLIGEIRGAATMLVGRNDAKRSCTLVVEGPTQVSGSEVIDLVSDKEIMLRVGHSMIHIGPSAIEISSPKVTVRGKDARLLLQDGEAKVKTKARFQVVSEDKVLLVSSGASLSLGSEAKLDGAQVLLNSPDRATDNITSSEPEPTKVELVDQEGHPIPYQRFVIDLDDGSRVSGFLDGDGKAEVDVEGGGQISFPDLADVDEG
ncbi:MAG: type VI secretion system tip protein TssI/VgrG [Byssovorax sp.]